jgi:hypothetical protein
MIINKIIIIMSRLNIYNAKKINLPFSITYDDLTKICKILNIPDQIGNVIDLPITEEWRTLMSTNSHYNILENVRFHYLRRIIFYVPIDINSEITTFSTDYAVNSASVLTHEDVNNIFEAVRKIKIKKDTKLDETMIDPVTLELLVDPIIASDGITYSKSTLKRLFKDSNHPISPITREPLVRINKEFGIKNILISQIIELTKSK